MKKVKKVRKKTPDRNIIREMKYLWQLSTLFGLALFITCTVLAAISTVILQTSKKEIAEREHRLTSIHTNMLIYLVKMFDLDLMSADYKILPNSDKFVCRDFQSNFTNQAQLHATQFSGLPNVLGTDSSNNIIAQMVLHHCDNPVRRYFS